MCKPAVLMAKDQILQRLLTSSNGVQPKMEIGPSCSGQNLHENEIVTSPAQFKIEEVKWEENHGVSEDSKVTQLTHAPNLIKEDLPNLAFSFTPFNDLEENLLKSIRPEGKAVVDNLIDKIKQLSLIQKILLYLKLPSSRDDPDEFDPLRRPLNPLGNRFEVRQALAYIKTHFLPDPDVSLPKKEIYNEYAAYCLERKIRPLSTADFGKAMKQVYPVVRPRRLGERGNSRYCYSGLRNRNELNKPKIPGFPVAQDRDCISKKICGWASKILNKQVDNLTELSGIIPSVTASNGTEHFQDFSTGCLQSGVPTTRTENKRKIEAENAETLELRSPKQKKIANQQSGKLQKTNRTKGFKCSVGDLCAHSQHSVTLAAVSAAESDRSNDCDTDDQKKVSVDVLKIKNLHVNCFDLKTEKSTNLEKRKKGIADKHSSVKQLRRYGKRSNNNTAFEKYKSTKCSDVKIEPLPTEGNFDIVSIEEEATLTVNYNTKKVLNREAANDCLYLSRKPVITGESSQSCGDYIRKVIVSIDSSEAQDCDQTDMYNDIGYLATESLGHYLHDEGNSQEPEEELLKYFKDPVKSERKEHNSDKEISQATKYNTKPSERDTGFSEEDPSKLKQLDLKNCIITSLQQTLQQPVQKSSLPSVFHGGNSKRRVSFENIPDSFPQSPNTHRKNFSFTPISPRPPTVSKSTVNISPFVFPRETVFRGKLSITSICNNNSQQNPVPSPVLQSSTHLSPLKSSSHSTSLSCTPSPTTYGRSLSSNITFRGSSTPQDTQEQVDSIKSSPLISPSSSSGVFLSPASPMSSCNSPVFTFRKIMSPVKQPDDTKLSLKSNSSLLQSLLLTGKCPEIKTPNKNETKSLVIDGTDQKKIKPLAVDVYPFTQEESISPFRSQSVPTLTNSIAISPSSNTLPFPSCSFRSKEISPLFEIKPSEFDAWDSVLNGYKCTDDNLLMENTSDVDTVDSDSQAVENEMSVESVISNLCDFLNNKGLSGTGVNVKLPQVSRSHPNTPLEYNECSNSSRDPVVSAFPLTSASKSHPSTPTVCSSRTFNNTTINNSSAKRNIIPLLDNLTIPVPSFSDDIELHLNNLDDLSGCDDAFNVLAREVANGNAYKELP